MKPDITIKQVSSPENRYCSSGHVADITVILDNKIVDNRFFSVIGKNISGIYCEHCLYLANKIKRSKL